MSKFFSSLGFMVAALSFRKGEYLRRGWFSLSAGMLLFLINDLFFASPLPDLIGNTISVSIQAVVVAIGNVFMILGFWIIARAWSRSGFDFSEPKQKPWIMSACAVLMGVIVAGPAVYANLMRLLGGRFEARVVIAIVSAIGTTFVLSMIARLLLTVKALKETNLRWPWMYLSIVLLSWLFWDGLGWWGPFVGFSAGTTLCVSEIFRIFGCMFGVSAGLAQRYLQQEIRMSRPTASA